MTDLPYFTQDHERIDEDDDWWFDNGEVTAYVTFEGTLLRMHELDVKDRGLVGARSGVGRRALQAMRPHFEQIVADGVLHPFADSPDDKPLLFWQAMLAEGLIDAMILSNCDVEIVASDLGGDPVKTNYGPISFPIDPVPERPNMFGFPG